MGLFNGASLERKVYKVEKEPVTSEEENKDESSENGEGKMNEWFTENLRMIVSVVIVVVIAGGIYSYSKRAQAPNMNKSDVSTEESSEGKISVIGGDNQVANTDQQESTETIGEPKAQPSENVQVSEPQTSQETETSFVETAAKGEGSTNLARRALANYLEKNPDPALTAEHKIYIEDLLRRQVKDGRMKIGDKREFTKDMIANSIEKSKTLNEKQLQNLQKYSQRVSALK